MFNCVSDIVDPEGTKKEKGELDNLVQFLSSQLTHQSEKDYPRTSMSNGRTDGTKMCGKEKVAILAI